MNVLIFGSDSCAHAFAWKLVNSSYVHELILAPGNAGTTFFAPSATLAPDDSAAIANFALSEAIDLIVVDQRGIAAGVSDDIAALPLPVFGARQAFDRLVTSRCAAREWMQQHGLPAPRSRVCAGQVQAEKYAATLALPVVIVPDAPDDQVVLCSERTAIPRAIAACLEGSADKRVLIEEYVGGPIITASLLTDGTAMVPVPPVRLYPQSSQPYAPAVGAHSMATPVWQKLDTVLQTQIRQPLMAALQRSGAGGQGWIGAICVAGQRGPVIQSLHLLPSGLEAATILSRLESDLLPLLIGCARGTLAATQSPRWNQDAIVAVALRRAANISGNIQFTPGDLEGLASGILLFHHLTVPALPNTYVPHTARYTSNKPGRLSFGFNLTSPQTHTATSTDPLVGVIVARADDLPAARDRIYAGLRQANLKQMTYAQDIGNREL